LPGKKGFAFEVRARFYKMRDNWHGTSNPAGLFGLVSALYDLQALSALNI